MMIITIVMEHTRHSHSLLYYNNTIRWRMVRLLCYSNPLSSTWIELLSGDEHVDRIAFRCKSMAFGQTPMVVERVDGIASR